MGMIRLSLSRGMVDEVLLLSSSTYDTLVARAGLQKEPDALCTPLTVLALRGVALLRKGDTAEAQAIAEEALSQLVRLSSWPSVHTFVANASVLEVLCALLSDAIYHVREIHFLFLYLARV